ncbi:MAG: hypothetical protein RLZZ387_628 [Chloroflexota bacterium]|jgi:uncharacterized cupin superfamily protein/DNA-binding XRE family transcriptional regulator
MIQGKLGARLRQIRLERGITVRALAGRSGFSPSFISQVEADLVSPSITSLEKIVGQLGVTLGQLFTSLEHVPRRVVRVGERVTYNSDWSRSRVEALCDMAATRRLSAVLVTFAPEGTSGKRPALRLQDTFALVLSGSLEVTLEDSAALLEAGDSLYLSEGDVFMMANRTDAVSTVLLVSVAGRMDQLGYEAPTTAEE